MTASEQTLSERDEIELLLPWYVTGRLDAADRTRVEHWLARDADLKQQLTLIREEQDESLRAAEAVRLPASLTVDKTFAAVTRVSPAVSALRSAGLALKSLFDGTLGAPLRWTAAAAGLALLVQTAAIGYLLTSRPDATYVTASGGQTAGQATGTFALVRFADAATAKDIAAALLELDASIVEGPRQGALYKVRIGAAGMDAAARDQRLAALRGKAGLIMFVTATP